jgi:hypothetical protein
LVITLLACGALFLVFRLVFKESTKAGILATLVVVPFLLYGFFYDALFAWIGKSAWILLPIWLVLFTVCFVIAVRSKKELTKATHILNLVALVLVLINVVSIVRFQIQNPIGGISQIKSHMPPDINKPQLDSESSLPDIYLILPDDYQRSDDLKHCFGYDDQQFTDYLEQKGFEIANQSQSNYLSSEFNMNAILNLDYFSFLSDILGSTKSENLVLQRRMIQDSRASRFLKSLGYRYVHIDSDIITFADRNPDIATVDSPDTLDYFLLKGSILRAFGGKFGFNNEATNSRLRKSIETAFDRLETASTTPGPKFVLFHCLPPHDPYVFGANGEPVTFPDNLPGPIHGSPLEMGYYVNQLKYLEKKLMDATDAILANSETPPIIIIQSDEGYEPEPPFYSEDVGNTIRAHGFSAYYLPGNDKTTIPPNLAGVNTFRYVFDKYFSTNLGLLPVRTYLSDPEHPYRFDELQLSADYCNSSQP